MKRIAAILLMLTALSACGADGEPVQPSLNAHVGLSSNGVYAAGGIGLHKGPVSLYMGF